MKATSLILLFCCIFLKSYSQFSNYAFGNVTKEELLMNDCPFEPGAPAMILGEKCELIYNVVAPFYSKKMTRRIKIFKKEGFSYGTFEIEFNRKTTDITFDKIMVYNLENDLLVTNILNEDNYHKTETVKHFLQYTITMPNVKEGSIIDLNYTISSHNSMDIAPWYFQSEIPCGWSEYKTTINKISTFNYYYTDFLPFVVNTIKTPEETTDKRKAFIINRFAVENAPSYHLNESFILRPGDQLSKVELVYSAYNQNSFWGNGQGPITWTQINTNLLRDPYLGKVPDRGKFLQDSLEMLFVNCFDYEEHLRKVYEYIRRSVKCDGFRSIYAGNIQKIMADKSGNTGEINLLLLAALRQAGFDCHPLLLATNEDAPPSKTDPRRYGVNYLVAAVFTDTSYYLLDASKREIAFNTLPARCLNGDGFLVSNHTHEQWIPLMRNERFEVKNNISYAWDPEKPDTVHVEKSSYSLSANKLRSIQQEKGDDEYIKSRKLAYQNNNISTPQFTWLNETDKPLIESFSFMLKPVDYNTSESYFLQTIPFDTYKENPFDGIKRDFNIDFQAPNFQDYDVTVKIPKGFRIVSIPESVAMKGIGNDLIFDFSVTADADQREVRIHSDIRVKRASFSKEEYNDIRQFFATIVKSQNTLIELKKD